MKKYLPIAASVLLLAACSEKPGYEITGTVSNSDLNGKYVYLYEYGVKDAAPLDSALVQNGSFALKGTQNAPALRTLRFSEEVVEPVRVAPGENAPFMATFVLENGKLAVVLDSTSTVSGTPENDAQKELQAKIKDLRSGIDKLVADMKSGDENLIKQAEARSTVRLRKPLSTTSWLIQINSLPPRTSTISVTTSTKSSKMKSSPKQILLSSPFRESAI